MRIYSRTGDRGETGLPGGRRVAKYDVRVAACGDLDELNACLGLAAALLKNGPVRVLVLELQSQVLGLGADIAAVSVNREPRPHITSRVVESLERVLDTMEPELPELRNFVLPGGTPAAAALHLARAVCRRAERTVVRLSQSCSVPPEHLAYLNRLSDLLFMLARAENAEGGVSEAVWRPSDRGGADG